MFKELKTIDIAPLLDYYNQVEGQLVWTESGNKGRQTSVQYKPGEDPWTSSVGRSKGIDILHTELNPFFKGTVVEDIINEYSLLRTRFMWVNPFSCYTMHYDYTPRIHIPLITNPECYFVFKEGKIIHMPVGKSYWTDTRHLHTFMNCSDSPRLHLVGVVKS
jgi:hypothetical protein